MVGKSSQDSGAPTLDIAGNRASPKWSRSELFGRLLWEAFGSKIFALTPRPFWGARRAILRLFGAKIGDDVHVFPSVRIAIPWNLEIEALASIGDRAVIYNLGKVSIGARATVSQHAHLCAGTHDYLSAGFDLLKPPITIENEAWVCSDAFVGPGVTVGQRAIVAARAVVVKDVRANSIVAGNPAQARKKRGGVPIPEAPSK